MRMKPVAAETFTPSDAERRTQFAALCWRSTRGRTEVLLVTSRETGRWVIPKGWPIAGLSPAEAAAREAWEEAGAKGKMAEQALGFFTYDKVLDRASDPVALPCIVAVFPPARHPPRQGLSRNARAPGEMVPARPRGSKSGRARVAAAHSRLHAGRGLIAGVSPAGA